MEAKALIFIHDRSTKKWLYEDRNGCPGGVGEQIMKYVMNSNFDKMPDAEKVYEDLQYTYKPIDDYTEIEVEWRYDIWVQADAIVYACEEVGEGEQYRVYKMIDIKK